MAEAPGSIVPRRGLRRFTPCFMLAMVCAVFAMTAVSGGEPPASRPTTSLSQESDEVLFTRVDQLTENHDLAGMEALAGEIRSTFRTADPVRYGKLTAKVCGNLTTFDFKDDRRNGLASSLSLDALELADHFPLDMELRFVERLRYDADAAGPLSGARWEAVRRRQAEAWLHARRRLHRLANEKWDPAHQPEVDGLVPGFEYLASGAAPSVISDPEKRQQYARALAARRVQAERYLEHVTALRRLPRYDVRFEQYMVAIYSKPPHTSEEFRSFLKQSDLDAGEQARMLRAVEAASREKSSSRPSPSRGGE